MEKNTIILVNYNLAVVRAEGEAELGTPSILLCSGADPDMGCGIRCFYDPWIGDPGWKKIHNQEPG